MIKKFFKWIFKLIVGIILLIAVTYGGFHLWEYATGGKFVEYLEANSETIKLEENFSYDLMRSDLEKNDLILVGEIHGFHEPIVFDVDFFKYLHKNHGVRHYVVELDFVQGQLMNEYLVTGDQDILKTVLKKWVVVQGRNNQDYFDKYAALQQFYGTLPETAKFKFIGIDRIQDYDLITEYVENFPSSDSIQKAGTTATLLDKINSLSVGYSGNEDTLFLLSHVKENLLQLADKVNREAVLFSNFEKLFKQYKLQNRKLYGYFGLYHVFQYRVNGADPLASKIRASDLNLDGKILSINFLMNDSYMVMPSQELPEFMREPGPYTRMPISADNMLFMYLVGIKDFNRMTPESSKSLVKLNAEDSPYSNTIRMNQAIQLLPVTDLLEFNDKGKPYTQYTIFVRNSDWAQPMESK